MNHGLLTKSNNKKTNHLLFSFIVSIFAQSPYFMDNK